MKRKGLVLMLCALGLIAMFISIAQAAPPTTPPWYYCTVQGAGATGSDAYIIVTDIGTGAAFTARTFIIDNSTGKANQMLAGALTAFANSTNLICFIPDTTEFALTYSAIGSK